MGDLKWMSNMEARNTRWRAGPVTEPSQLSGILVLGHLLGPGSLVTSLVTCFVLGHLGTMATSV